ncbi:DNA repair protein RecF [Anopheles sinensis]|uniref:DNA repair protein RecF n=1 Tax=Anopheles sinensis TaxID=74873 RepID=A0A084VA66_ANOSI|nr:DNA repair protein RecF [Anopheles sinensis]
MKQSYVSTLLVRSTYVASWTKSLAQSLRENFSPTLSTFAPEHGTVAFLSSFHAAELVVQQHSSSYNAPGALYRPAL